MAVPTAITDFDVGHDFLPQRPNSANPDRAARVDLSDGALASLKFQLQSGSGVGRSALCVPSMHRNQKGFKSPVHRMKISKRLSEANCGRATDRGKEG